MASTITLNTLHRAFTCTSRNQRFTEGADYRAIQNQHLLQRIINWLAETFTCGRYGDNTDKEVNDKRSILTKDLSNITTAILKVKSTESGGLEHDCYFKIENQHYRLTTRGGRLVIANAAYFPDDTRELPFNTLAELKRAMLIEYLKSERSKPDYDKNAIALDLSEFDLTGVNFNGIDLEGVKPIDGELGEAVIAQACFSHDLITMLTVYSQTVASIIMHSASRDVADHASPEILLEHGYFIESYKLKYQRNDLNRVRSAIKFSAGNCHEIAVMCKCLFDLYLEESLKKLGYKDFSFMAFHIATKEPADHAAVELACTFQGITKRFIIDPWSGGKAWTKKDGMSYFRTRRPDRYTNSQITFEASSKNAYFGSREVRAKTKGIFTELGVNAQLQLAIEENAQNFVGAPTPQGS